MRIKYENGSCIATHCLLAFMMMSFSMFIWVLFRLVIPKEIMDFENELTLDKVNTGEEEIGPVARYIKEKTKAKSRLDFPWLNVQEDIPYFDIPLFDTLRKNARTVADKV